MLEKMVGIGKWDNCTIVTTKWGCTDSPAGEESREKKLRNDDKYFKTMCESSEQAHMRRFLRTKGSAMEIIKPHLNRKFAPAISMQMVDSHGPKLSLGQTDAGRIVIDNLQKANLMIEEQVQARKSSKLGSTSYFLKILGRKETHFDAKRYYTALDARLYTQHLSLAVSRQLS